MTDNMASGREGQLARARRPGRPDPCQLVCPAVPVGTVAALCSVPEAKAAAALADPSETAAGGLADEAGAGP